MKKLALITIALIMTLSLAACGGGSTQNDMQEEAPSVSTQPQAQVAESDEYDAQLEMIKKNSAKQLEYMLENGIDGAWLLELTKSDIVKLLGQPDSIAELKDYREGWTYREYDLILTIYNDREASEFGIVANIIISGDRTPVYGGIKAGTEASATEVVSYLEEYYGFRMDEKYYDGLVTDTIPMVSDDMLQVLMLICDPTFSYVMGFTIYSVNHPVLEYIGN